MFLTKILKVHEHKNHMPYHLEKKSLNYTKTQNMLWGTLFIVFPMLPNFTFTTLCAAIHVLPCLLITTMHTSLQGNHGFLIVVWKSE